MKVEVLGKGRFLTLVSEDGWESVEQSFAEGTVAVLPITGGGEVVLVEQYRPPVRARVIEIPAGMVGDVEEHRGEALETAVHRELEEETGYVAEELHVLGRGPSSGGILKEIVNLYAATGVEKVGDGGGVGQEEIVVHVVPVAGLDAWLARREAEGMLVDLRVLSAVKSAEYRGLL